MAKKIVNIKEISHDDWLTLRKKSIGGSDAGAILGMNQYASPITVYLEKLDLSTKKESSEAMRLGNDLEGYVASRFMEETGKKVINDNFMYAHDNYEWMTANIDRRVVGENAGVECKTMSVFGDYDLEGGEVPAHYYCQCQHYMAVMGFDRMYLSILVLQKGIYVLTIDRNEEFISEMIEKEKEFWQQNVESKQMPAPDGSDATEEALKELYPDALSGKEIHDPELDKYIKEYMEISEATKRLDERKKELKGYITVRLEDAEYGIGDNYKCSYKSQTRNTVDSKRLKAEMPDIYNKYVTSSTSRVMRVNKIKN